jgi:DNA-binding transcriptional regulator/RsmH inhibitor MraZ
MISNTSNSTNLRIINRANFKTENNLIGKLANLQFHSEQDFNFAIANKRAIALELKNEGYEFIGLQLEGKPLALEHKIADLVRDNNLIDVSVKLSEPKAVFTFRLDLEGIYKDVIVGDHLKHRLWGFEPDEFKGRYMESILPVEIARERREYFSKAIFRNEPITYEQNAICDGEPLNKMVSIYPNTEEAIVIVSDL